MYLVFIRLKILLVAATINVNRNLEYTNMLFDESQLPYESTKMKKNIYKNSMLLITFSLSNYVFLNTFKLLK